MLTKTSHPTFRAALSIAVTTKNRNNLKVESLYTKVDQLIDPKKLYGESSILKRRLAIIFFMERAYFVTVGKIYTVPHFRTLIVTQTKLWIHIL